MEGEPEEGEVVAANFGGGDDRFVIGWHSVRGGSSDIQLLAVDGSGTMSNSFPGSLSALTGSGSAVVGGDFRFASLSGNYRNINDLTIVWNETVNDAKGAVDHGILKATKLRYAANIRNRFANLVDKWNFAMDHNPMPPTRK